MSEPVQPALPVTTPRHCSGLSLLTQPLPAFTHSTVVAVLSQVSVENLKDYMLCFLQWLNTDLGVKCHTTV